MLILVHLRVVRFVNLFRLGPGSPCHLLGIQRHNAHTNQCARTHRQEQMYPAASLHKLINSEIAKGKHKAPMHLF